MNGKICYLEIPADSIEESSNFYSVVFGWQTRTRGDGSLAFDDATGGVSGNWKLDRPPMTDVGLLVYVMVESVASTIEGPARPRNEARTGSTKRISPAESARWK